MQPLSGPAAGSSPFEGPFEGPTEARRTPTTRVDGRRTTPARTFAASVALSWLALTALFVAIGLTLVHGLRGTAVLRLDDDWTAWLATHRTHALNAATAPVSRLADTEAMVAAALAGSIVLLAVRRWAAVVLLTAIGLELSVFLAVNSLVDRARPDVHRLGSTPGTNSFPSGHTAATIAMYGGLALLVTTGRPARPATRVLRWVPVAAAAAIVAFARVYRGMHHPTDVLCGALLGVGALVAARWSVTRAAGRDCVVLPTDEQAASIAPAPTGSRRPS